MIVSPIWPNITSATRLVRGEPKYVALDRKPDGSWKLDLQKVFDAVDDRTRAIFVNSPGNPTGWTMSIGRAARACSTSPGSAACGSWPTRSMPG